MQNTKFLSLKDSMNELIIAHDSCLLDRNFIERYTTLGTSNREIREKQRQILEREKQFAEQQRKIILEERKRRQAEKNKALSKSRGKSAK